MIEKMLINNTKINLQSPYTIFSVILIISSPLFFLRGIGVFDDSVYLKIGELITDGLLPYRDIFDNKTPGIYYLAALIAWIGNKHWLTNRIFLFVFALLLGFLIIRYTKSLWGNKTAYYTAILFPVSYVICQGYSYHTEQFCALFGFTSLLVITNKRKNYLYNWFLSGICLAFSFTFKQVGIIYLVSFLIANLIFVLLGRLTVIAFIRRCLFLILGFSVVLFLEFAIIYISGYWQIFYNDVFVGVIPFTQNKIDILAVLRFWAKTPVSLLLIPLCLLTISSSKKIKNIIVSENFYEFIFLLISGFLSILPTLKVNSNTHYMGTAVIALAISESVLIQTIFQKNTHKITHYKKLGHVFLIFLILTYIMGIFWISKTMVFQNRIASDLSQMTEIRYIVNKYTPSETPVLVLSPLAPRLYYMSGRLPYMRYIYYYFNTGIQIDEAAKILQNSDVPIAILDLPTNEVDWLSEEYLATLKQRYLFEPISSPSSIHLSGSKIVVLISKKYIY